jgi:ubiquinone/menaquinone biosynthesis C-methylase UbiE
MIEVIPDFKLRAFRSLPKSTRRIYDLVAHVYPVSTLLFHSRAHETALSLAGISSGMKVLEVATGSGEMFRRIMKANPGGLNCGIDLSPKMAARTQRVARKRTPGGDAWCQAVDARQMPFRDASFDAVVCCYLLELLSEDDILRTLREMHRVLRPRGRLALVLIGQQLPAFNVWYRAISKVAPAFLGRQVESAIPAMMRECGFSPVHDLQVRQGCYPSRIVVARK